ncbi:MAG TPA: hypothetical protein VKA48_03005, partial [Gammaproteobacteria bacterium]|nr:hypothetical protein [Gammaproteobacteria bacterium]
ELLLAGRQWAELSRLLYERGPALLAAGRHRTLEGWLSALPPAVLQGNPWLGFFLGVARVPFDPLAAQRLLEEAYSTFLARNDPEGVFLTWSEIVCAYAFFGADLAPLGHWLEELERLRQRHPLPDQETGFRVAVSALTALMWYRPEKREMALWENRVERGLKPGSRDRFQVLGALHLGLVRATRGDLDKAGKALAFFRQGSEGEEPPLLRLSAALLESVYFQYTGRPQSWREPMERAERVAREAGLHFLDPHRFSLEVCGCLNGEDPEAAEAVLTRYHAILERCSPLEVGHYFELRGWVSLVWGEPGEAAEYARQALRILAPASMPWGEAHTHLGLGFALLRSGDAGGAREQAERVLGIASYMGSDMLTVAGLSLEAQAWLRSGDRTRGLRALARALRIARERGYISIPLLFPEQLTPLYLEALRAGIEPTFVRHCIRTRGLSPPPTSTDPGEWPWPIRIHTFGGFEILLDDAPVGLPEGRTGRPLEMLKAIIALGGREVPESRLAETLWPNAEGDAVRRTLDTNIYRIRHLLGSREALVLKGGKVTLDPRLVWTDARALARTMRRLRQLA